MQRVGRGRRPRRSVAKPQINEPLSKLRLNPKRCSASFHSDGARSVRVEHIARKARSIGMEACTTPLRGFASGFNENMFRSRRGCSGGSQSRPLRMGLSAGSSTNGTIDPVTKYWVSWPVKHKNSPPALLKYTKVVARHSRNQSEEPRNTPKTKNFNQRMNKIYE